MNATEKRIIANRIVQSCDFVTEGWEFYMMFNILVEALEWGEQVSSQTEAEDEQ